jgi:hypothetical protein
LHPQRFQQLAFFLAESDVFATAGADDALAQATLRVSVMMKLRDPLAAIVANEHR